MNSQSGLLIAHVTAASSLETVITPRKQNQLPTESSIDRCFASKKVDINQVLDQHFPESKRTIE